MVQHSITLSMACVFHGRGGGSCFGLRDSKTNEHYKTLANLRNILSYHTYAHNGNNNHKDGNDDNGNKNSRIVVVIAVTVP